MSAATLETRYRAGDARALARAVTLAEAGLDSARPCAVMETEGQGAEEEADPEEKEQGIQRTGSFSH